MQANNFAQIKSGSDVIGRRILNYEILEKLGAGGHGEVYKALDTKLNRPVVIKVLPHELTDNERNLKRFEREAQLISSLDHPNVCTVYEFDEVDGLHLMVMQLIEGRTVRELVNGRPLKLQTALRIGIQVADALAATHARNIIHRDIKAGNVMVTDDGLVKILDFGLAKFIETSDQDTLEQSIIEQNTSASKQFEITETGSPRGTATYAAPEQARGEDVDHRADIFSIGVLLYEMLTGTWPFHGKNVQDVRSALISDEPLPIAARRGEEIPGRLQATVSKAMAKTPDARYQSAAELRDELAILLREISTADGETDALLERVRMSAPQFHRVPTTLQRAVNWIKGQIGSDETDTTTIEEALQSAAEDQTADKGTLAILPFRNLSGDPDYDFYEFALADTVITELSQLPSIIVRPSAAMMNYQAGDNDPFQVGRELKVANVLSASFLRHESRMNVTAQLLDVDTGNVLWSERLTTEETDIISLIDTIAQRISTGLHLTLTSADPIQHETTNTKAFIEYLQGRNEMKNLIDNALASYDEYLRGRDVMGRFIYRALNKEQIEAAIAHFSRAIELDPQFARAHSGLGSCYTSRIISFAGNNEDYLAAEVALNKALALDPNNVEANTNKVFFLISQGKKDMARRKVADLLKTHPHDVGVQFIGSFLYRLDGDYEKALSCLTKLLRLNPRERVVVGYSRARILIYQRRYELALAELEKAEQVRPNHPLIQTFRAMCWFLQGKVSEAQKLLEELLQENPEMDGIRPHYAMCLAAMGDHAAAREQLNERVKQVAALTQDVPYWVATAYVMLGEDREAFQWLEKAISIGNENLPWFKTNPIWQRLYNDPRFQAIINLIDHSKNNA